jgi:serine/threonine protein kinase
LSNCCFCFSLSLYLSPQGSLRSALNQQRLVDPSSQFRVPAVHLVLALAHDVACAMLHLHSEQIVHSDLKASNVLLTKANTFAPFTAAIGDGSIGSGGSGSAGGGLRPDSCAAMLAKAQALAGGRLVAKVADFGEWCLLCACCLSPCPSPVLPAASALHSDSSPLSSCF